VAAATGKADARPSRRPPYLLLVVALAAFGCSGGQTGSEGPRGVSSGAGSGAVQSGCVSDADCARRIEDKLAPLRAPRAAPRRVVAAECVAMPSCSNLPPSTCKCSIATDGSAAVQVYLLGGSTCAVYGRGLDCLSPPGEQRVCTPGTCDCAQMCAEARDLLVADDARAIVAQADAARCGQTCQYVVQLKDRCYAGDSLAPGAPEVACSGTEVFRATASDVTTGAAGRGEAPVSCPTSWSISVATTQRAVLDPCLTTSAGDEL
jgi:hypothetical protein